MPASFLKTWSEKWKAVGRRSPREIPPSAIPKLDPPGPWISDRSAMDPDPSLALCGPAWGWVAKDLILYPFVWRAYTSGENLLKHPSRRAQGAVIRDLSPLGTK